MATTAASAGKNSRTRREAISTETDLQANRSGKPELSGDGSKTMKPGVVKNRVLIIVGKPSRSLRSTGLKGGLFAPRERGSTSKTQGDAISFSPASAGARNLINSKRW
jgi:hypothetical protein